MQRNLIQLGKSNSNSSLHLETAMVLSLLEHVIREPLYNPRSLLQMKKFPLQKLDPKQFFTYFTIQSVNLLTQRGWSFIKDLSEIEKYCYNDYLALPTQLQHSPLINLIVASSIIENADQEALIKMENLDEDFHILSSKIQEVIQNRNFNYGILDTNSSTYQTLKDILHICQRPLPFISKFHNVYQLEDYLAFIDGELTEESFLDNFLNFDDYSDVEDLFAELAIPQPEEFWIFNKEHQQDFQTQPVIHQQKELDVSLDSWILEETKESLQRANKESLQQLQLYYNSEFIDTDLLQQSYNNGYNVKDVQPCNSPPESMAIQKELQAPPQLRLNQQYYNCLQSQQ